MRLHGNTDTRPILDRLWERTIVDPVTACRLWQGSRAEFGHGRIRINRKLVYVHRAAWQAERGPIPEGLDCLHDCPGGDNPACWHVDHLWLGTQADNNADCITKGRQVVLRGSENSSAKLTDDQVAELRDDPRRYEEIAATYGITAWQVGNIMRADQWAHLPGARSRKCADAHCFAKITSEIVRLIRSDGRPHRLIAKDYGIAASNVSLIKRRLAWASVQ